MGPCCVAIQSSSARVGALQGRHMMQDSLFVWLHLTFHHGQPRIQALILGLDHPVILHWFGMQWRSRPSSLDGRSNPDLSCMVIRVKLRRRQNCWMHPVRQRKPCSVHQQTWMLGSTVWRVLLSSKSNFCSVKSWVLLTGRQIRWSNPLAPDEAGILSNEGRNIRCIFILLGVGWACRKRGRRAKQVKAIKSLFNFSRKNPRQLTPHISLVHRIRMGTYRKERNVSN